MAVELGYQGGNLSSVAAPYLPARLQRQPSQQSDDDDAGMARLLPSTLSPSPSVATDLNAMALDRAKAAAAAAAADDAAAVRFAVELEGFPLDAFFHNGAGGTGAGECVRVHARARA